jgi:hypothetical protein
MSRSWSDGINCGAPIDNLQAALRAEKLESVDLWIANSNSGVPVARLLMPLLKPKAYVPVHWDGVHWAGPSAFEAGVQRPFSAPALEAFLEKAGVQVVSPGQYMNKWRLDRKGIRAVPNIAVKKALGFESGLAPTLEEIIAGRARRAGAAAARNTDDAIGIARQIAEVSTHPRLTPATHNGHPGGHDENTQRGRVQGDVPRGPGSGGQDRARRGRHQTRETSGRCRAAGQPARRHRRRNEGNSRDPRRHHQSADGPVGGVQRVIVLDTTP